MNQRMVLVVWAGLFLGACRENDLGTGANTVTREYSKPAPEAWTAAQKCAEAAGLKVTSARHDEMGGDLVASRGNGSEVRIEVKSLDEKTSRVSVRVEPGDRELANQLHERIAERVGLGTAETGLFRGNSVQGTYTADLATGLGWSRKAFEALGVRPTADETHAMWFRLDGRLKDSTPVQIRVEKKGEVRIVATFIAGHERSEDHEAFARRMKDEFEKLALAEGGSN